MKQEVQFKCHITLFGFSRTKTLQSFSSRRRRFYLRRRVNKLYLHIFDLLSAPPHSRVEEITDGADLITPRCRPPEHGSERDHGQNLASWSQPCRYSGGELGSMVISGTEPQLSDRRH